MAQLSYRETQNIQWIVSQFETQGEEIIWILPIETGRINSTYKIVMKLGNSTISYLLQKLNTYVFKGVIDLMDNALLVTEHISKKGGATIKYIKRRRKEPNSNNWYLLDCGTDGCWRLSEFIHSEVFQYVTKPEDMTALGWTICNFSKQLSDLDCDLLYETIPRFHDTHYRFDILMMRISNRAIMGSKDSFLGLDRVREASEEIRYVQKNCEYTRLLVDALAKGEIRRVVTHNDPKLNNVLFDRRTNFPVCMIDLDTVMPGTILYDIGDALRYGANWVSEEETNAKDAGVNFELFTKFIEGCASGGDLTQREIELIPDAFQMMALELGIRFLTDYIDGDEYFKTEYEEQNLTRCRVQFALAQDIENKKKRLCEIVKDTYSKNGK